VIDDVAGRGTGELGSLVASADVVIDGTDAGAGPLLAWEDVHTSNPATVLCQITGYAGLARHAGRPVTESLVAARTGQQWEQRGWVGGPIEHLLGRPGPHPDLEVPAGAEQGPDRDGPLQVSSAFGATTAGFLAALGINAALVERERTGLGQLVGTSLLQAFQAMNFSGWQHPEHPDVPGYWMWVLDRRAPKGIFECADGRWVHQWPMNPAAVVDAADSGDLLAPGAPRNRDDERRLGMSADDLVVLEFYVPQLVEAFRKHPSEDWVRLGERIDVGVQVVRSPEEALVDPGLLDDGCVVEVDDPDLGSIRHLGVAFQLAATPGRVRGPAPAIGADTDAVVGSLATDPVPTGRQERRRSAELPLRGVRVVDLGLGVAGPYAGHLLATLGADVIKVNTLWDGFWLSTHMGQAVNRGKRSLAVNLKDPRGREVVQRLCATADVVTHNMRGGVAERLGLDAATVAATNPGVVYCHSRGFERGPRLPLPATDQTSAALAGLEWDDGGCAQGGRPFWSPTSLGDTGNGFLSAIAIVQALLHRSRTGVGQEVDTSILNACLVTGAVTWVGADGAAPERPRLDAGQHGFGALRRLYATADGWVCVDAADDHLAALRDALGLAGAPSSDDEALASAIAAAVATRPTTEVLGLLDGAGVPAERSDDGFASALLHDEDAWSRGLLSKDHHPLFGDIVQHGRLIDLSTTTESGAGPSPLCGQHSAEILEETGLDTSTVQALIADGVVLDGRP
jgi:crotonobetainyl-CoA:carnitine CoA-transferase CaiB-like acyl-CoA transferase